MTPHAFAQALLAQLGLPYTANNLAALVAAQAIEGGAMAPALVGSHNPLNTTQRRSGSKSITPVGVQSYPSWAEGLGATADTLTNGRYDDILASLRADADPDETLSQKGWKTWGWTSAIRPAASYASYSEKVFPEPKGSGAGVWFALGGAALVGLGLWLWGRR